MAGKGVPIGAGAVIRRGRAENSIQHVRTWPPGSWLSPDPESADSLNLDLSASRTGRQIFVVYRPVRGVLFKQPELTKTVINAF